MFQEFHMPKNSFRKKYLPHLINRFSNASLEVEHENGNFASPMQAMKLFYQSQAIEYALDQDPKEMLSLSDIIEIEKLVTCEEHVGFRRTRAEVAGSNVLRTPANKIYMAMYDLLNNYYNIWCDADPFWREAKFHIQFLHIHPFEDGNGRTARVLLFRNLCANGEVPCVITKEVKKEYCSYIENNDVEGLANLLRRLSKDELVTILNIYKWLNDRELIPENLMTEEQEKEYCRLSNKTIDHGEIKGPLRDVNNLISIFKYSMLPKDSSEQLTITGLHSFEHILDENSSDCAVYCEESRTLNIKFKGDPRYFKLAQIGNTLVFLIDDVRYTIPEFQFEIKHAGKEQNKVRVLK